MQAEAPVKPKRKPRADGMAQVAALYGAGIIDPKVLAERTGLSVQSARVYLGRVKIARGEAQSQQPRVKPDAPIAQVAANAFDHAARRLLEQVDVVPTQAEICRLLDIRPGFYSNALHGRGGSIDTVHAWLIAWGRTAPDYPPLYMVIGPDEIMISTVPVLVWQLGQGRPPVKPPARPEP